MAEGLRRQFEYRLTDKAKAFAKHYVETHNAKKAAELAGYTGNTRYMGKLLLKRTCVIEHIEQLENMQKWQVGNHDRYIEDTC